ncbi:MAG TPA: ABC transporter permease [Thermoplasmata archaeon]|nr:ABC transporter permease [Thermoplasmata archaeon]
MRMWIYVVRRIALLIPVLVGVMTITFALVSAIPTSERIASYYPANPRSNPSSPTIACPSNPSLQCPNPAYKVAVHALKLDQPIPVQWGYYIYNALTFHWGFVSQTSTVGKGYGGLPALKGDAVTSVLAAFLPYTLELALLSLFFVLIISIPLGNLAAVNRNRPIDQGARVMSFSGYALPGFILGSLVLMAAALWLAGGKATSPICTNSTAFLEFYGSWPSPNCWMWGPGLTSYGYPTWLINTYQSTPTGFPTIDALIHGDGWLALDTLVRIVLPALVIAYGTIALLLRFVRNSMLEVMNLDYVRTARAKGLPESRVIKKHAGRNSLNVTITVLGLTFAFFLSGFPVIESVFNLYGVGRIFAFSLVQSGGTFDFGLIFGTTILFTYLVVAANIIVDILYAYLDPRVRLG